MPTGNLCQELLKQYQCQTSKSANGATKSAIAGVTLDGGLKEQVGDKSTGSPDDEYLVAKKRRVVKFVRCWMLISREQFFHQPQIQLFLTVSIIITLLSILCLSWTLRPRAT